MSRAKINFATIGLTSLNLKNDLTFMSKYRNIISMRQIALNLRKEILLGKKRTRKKVTSQGLRRNVATKFDLWSPLERALFKVEARNKGKRVCETIRNPDKNQTNARFIRVCTNGK